MRTCWLLSLGQSPKARAKIAAMPIGLTVILLSVGLPYREDWVVWRASRRRSNSSIFNVTAPVVHVAPEAIDMRLDWHTASDVFNTTGASLQSGWAVINPSLLLLESASDGGAVLLARAARAHATSEVTLRGVTYDAVYPPVNVTEVRRYWHSKIVMSTSVWGDERRTMLSGWNTTEWQVALSGQDEPLEAVHVLSSFETNQGWAPLCEPMPQYDPLNRTLLRKFVTGPEDPKLLRMPSSVVSGSRFAMAFSSLPPKSTIPGCDQTDAAVTQMYMTQADEGSTGHLQNAPAVHLQCGLSTADEKNWIGFTHDGQLYYVYSIEPHRIVQVRAADGACIEIERYSTSAYAPLRRMRVHIAPAPAMASFESDVSETIMPSHPAL